MRKKERYLWQFIRLKKREEIGRRGEKKRKGDIGLCNANIIEKVEKSHNIYIYVSSCV